LLEIFHALQEKEAMTGVVFPALAGALCWTFLEYGLHRFLGHDRRTWPNAFASEQTRHHSEGDYFAPTWKKALVAIVAVPVASAAAVGLGLQSGAIFGVSVVGMCVACEIAHRRAYTHRGSGAYGCYLRRHHFHHHFANPHSNYGVTSPLWDIAFGTWEKPGRVRVPAKLRMRWLVDPRTGDVHADLAADYELIRRAV
jgi:sterol desaturase/sphingolipid hydroxylase (fatty acid hydroxylase superfamily)